MDEGLNGKISYVIDCLIERQSSIEEILFIEKKNESEINCKELFELKILSQSLLNQNDQLAIKLNMRRREELEDEYNLILYGIDNGLTRQLINSMKIKIKIEKILRKPQFELNEYNFILKENILNKTKIHLGKIKAKSNIYNEKIIYKILNESISYIELNSLTGELIFLNKNFICQLISVNNGNAQKKRTNK